MHRRIALALFTLLSGVYLLTASGHTYTIDEELMFGVAESLALRGSFALDSTARPEPATIYSTYGPGQSVAAVPFYLLGQGFTGLFPSNAYPWVTRAVTLWLNPFVTAAIAALIYLAAVTLQYSTRAAIGVALIYGLATFAWPHTKTFFAEPLTTLLLFGSLVALLQLRSAAPSRFSPQIWLLVSGFLGGLAPAVKFQGGLALPVLGCGALLLLWLQPNRSIRTVVSGLIAWGVGAGLALGLLGLFQWQAYGDPFTSGYGGSGNVLESLLNKNPWQGLYGLVLSPGKGLVWYALPLLLLPLALWQFARRNWPVALLCAVMVGVHLAFYARLSFWHGDGAWGPRYMNFILPFLCLPLVAYLDQLRGWKTPWRTGGLLVLLALMVPLQVGGLALNLNSYVAQSEGTLRYYQPRHSPIVHHLERVAAQGHNLYMRHVAGERVVLLTGFAYSEGRRSQYEQVPRWTLPQAEIALRPPQSAASNSLQLQLTLVGCRPEPVPPGEVRLQLPDAPLIVDTPCPPRTYHLLLPARIAELSLASNAWDPLALQIDREDGPLGVLLQDIAATTAAGPLPIDGALVPVPPLPDGAGPVTIREWVDDYRYEHWDFWWWYLPHTGFPATPSWVLAATWMGLVSVSIVGGVWLLRRWT